MPLLFLQCMRILCAQNIMLSPLCTSHTGEQYTEKQALLEDLKPCYEEREECKVTTAAAKKKEAKDHATALAMRRAALVPLGKKRKITQ